ncbi:MAG: replicative DNA helicase [Clostridia bacterium]|nr:replicative DNA helicase [Clostridia bacterium]
MDALTIGRKMPSSPDAEQAVLGAMILNREAQAIVFAALHASDFYQEAHKIIFEAMEGLFSQNKLIDLVTVCDALGARLDSVGGASYLGGLADAFFTIENLREHVRIIQEKALLRRLISAGTSITELCYDETEETSEIVEAAQQKLFAAVEGTESKNFEVMREVLINSVNALDKLIKSGGKIIGVRSGFSGLDQAMAGLQRSDLIIIAARPSMGKTAFALNIAQHVAVREKKVVAIFSLEMSSEQLVNRILCSEAMVNSSHFRIGDLSSDEERRIGSVLGDLAAAPLYIDDTPGNSVSQIRAKCRRLKMEKGLDLVVIDYMQLMSGSADKKSESRQNEISEISRSLKILAKEVDVPVIALSQLSRGPEMRADKRPMLSDLRESGSIEQDADVVMFLYRDAYYNKGTEQENIAECIIAKNRNGETKTVPMVFRGECVRFLETEMKYEDNGANG